MTTWFIDYLTRADLLLMVAILGQKLLLHRVLLQIFDSLLAGIDSHDYRMITVISFCVAYLRKRIGQVQHEDNIGLLRSMFA